MNPFDPMKYLHIGIDPKERTMVAITPDEDPIFLPPVGCFYHGDFGAAIYEALRPLSHRFQDKLWSYSMPAVPKGKWPRLYKYGSKWMEALTAIRIFDAPNRPHGTGLTPIYYWKRKTLRRVPCAYPEDKVTPSALTALCLAEAGRFFTRMPDDIIFT